MPEPAAADPPPSYADEVLADSPLAHWRLDEASGATSAADASGNGNAATPESGLVFGGSGLVFNDSGARTGGSVSFPATKVLNTPVTAGGRTALSVEAWVTRTPDGVDGVFDLGTSAGRLYFGSSSDPNLHWKVAGADVTFPYGTAMSSGTQYHLVGTWDGTTARLYLNGVQVASGATTASSLPTGTVTVGQGGGAFKGRIDEPAVYGAALSAERVLDHFESGNRAPETDLSVYGEAVLDDVPLGYWPLDEASSSVHPADLSGNARHAVARSGAVLGGPGLVYDPDGTITGGAASYATTASTEPESRVTAPVGLTGATAVSVEAWVQRDPSNADTLVDLGASVGSLGFTSSTGSGLRWSVAGATVSYAWAKLTAGATYHVVGTWDGTTARLYLNGTEVASAASTASSLAASAEVTVGNVAAGSSPHHGVIDEVAVYGTALDQPSIAAHFNAGWSGGSAAANAYSPAVTRDGPVGYWQLDEAPGAGRARDSSGGGWHAAVSSGAVLGADGLVNAADGTTTGTALQRTSSNATGADARVLSPLNLQGTTALTVEAWVQRQHHETDTIVDAGGEVVLRFSGGDTLTFTVGGSSVSIPFAGFFPDSIAAPPRGTYHIVGTWDGAALELFVNGQLVASGTGPSGALTGGPDLSIGSSAGGTNVFRGNVDEVAIYDTVLAPERVTAHWLRGRRTELPPPNARFAAANSLGPVGYWQFDEGADAEVAVDSTGHGRHAQVLPHVNSDVAEPGAWERRAFDWTTDGGDDDTDARVFAPVSMAGWDEFTLTGWIDRESPSASATLFHQQSGALLQFNNDDLIFGVDDQLTTWDCGTGDCPTLGHMAMTWDGTTATVYWQGEPLTSATAAATLTDAGPELVIGGTRGGSRDYDGRIDEVAVFDRALTASEIDGMSTPFASPQDDDDGANGAGCGGSGSELRPDVSACRDDPVSTSNGAFITHETDVTTPGPGFGFGLERTYSSARIASGPMGQGWIHSLDTHLDIAGSGDVTVQRGNGGRMLFDWTGSAFTAPPEALTTLAPAGTGYELTLQDQTVETFDGDGLLVEVADRNGNTATLTHDGSDLLDTVTDTAGRLIDFTHDGSGHLTEVELEDGRTVSYGYTSGLLTSATDLRGETTTYTYNADGLLETITDERGELQITNDYDPVTGRVVEQTDAFAEVTTWAWEEDGEVATVTDPRGNDRTDVYSDGVLVAEVDGEGGTTTYTYAEDLNRTSVTDPAGATTRMTYDSAGNLLTRTAPEPLAYEETWAYNSNNDPTSYTDGRGNTTAFAYDGDGNLTTITQPGSRVTELEPDPATGQILSITDPLNHTTELRYDAEGNLDEQELPTGETTTFTQDATGQVTSIVDPRGNEPAEDPDDYRTSYTLDDGGLPTLVTDPLGHETELAYDEAGNLTSVTDARESTTTWAFDEASRLTAVTAPGGAETAYTYDETWNLETRTDDNSHTTAYTYDGANRVTSMTNEIGTWTYALDPAGRTTETALAGGGTVGLTHDELGRVVGIDYSDSTPDVTFSYDANGNRTAMADGAGPATYTYDTLNRLQETTRGADTFEYSWDDAGRITARTYPDASETTYGYDNSNRMTTVTRDGNTTTYAYDAAGNRDTTAYPAGTGLTEDRTYDEAGRLTDIELLDGTSTVSQRTYTLDEVGNPTLVVDESSDPTSYLYDTRSRLTGVCFGVATCAGATDTIAWTYDGVGNRLAETRPGGTTTYSYNDADQLTATSGPAGPVTYGYDSRGNQTAAGPAEYAYDLANRMTAADTGTTATVYAYDGDGLRLAAEVAGDAAASRTWAWDTLQPIPEIAVETDGNDDPVTSSILGLDRVGFTDAADDTWYLHGDNLGSTTTVTDEAGDVAWSYTYEPYGLPTPDHIDTAAPENPWQYTGQHQDPTGLLHLRARQYDPSTGGFTATDPWQRPMSHPGVSSYAYGDARATLLVDPTGQWPSLGDVGGAIGGAVRGAQDLWVASRNAPFTAMSATYGAGMGGDCQIEARFTVACYGVPDWMNGYGNAVTIGNTTLYSDSDEEVGKNLMRHEYVHSQQWAVLGPNMAWLYMGAAVGADLLGDGPCSNPFEQQAGFSDGGYRRCV